jgi:hypothetical protein
MAEANPYLPPSADPSSPPEEVPDNSLWRVEGGRLLVQDGAILPKVCIFGTQPANDNPISAKPHFSEFRWAWAYNFLFCLPAVWVIIVYQDLSWTWTVAFLLAIFLPGLLVKKGRITAWSSDALVKRLGTVKGVTSIVIIVSIVMLTNVKDYLDENGIGGFPVLVAALLVVIDVLMWLYTRRHPRLLRAKEGGYELKNLSPHTLIRFEEIQQEREFILAHRERKRRSEEG